MQQLTDEQVDQLYLLRDKAFEVRAARKDLEGNLAYAFMCELLLILAPRGLNGQ